MTFHENECPFRENMNIFHERINVSLNTVRKALQKYLCQMLRQVKWSSVHMDNIWLQNYSDFYFDKKIIVLGRGSR